MTQSSVSKARAGLAWEPLAWQQRRSSACSPAPLLSPGFVCLPSAQVRWSQQIVIEQPGMSIRINRVWDSRRNSFWDWFDIWVFLTRAPRWPLTGVLGSTFPRPQAGAAGAAAASAGGGGGSSSDLVGGFVLPVATPKNRG